LRYWLFFSKSLENVETAVKHLLWGFPSKDRIKEKDEKTTEEKWEKFLGYYNSIKPLDVVFFQIQNSEKKFYIHAIGIVRDKYYDDQTLIWSDEKKNRAVLYPWRVSFGIIIYSEEPFKEFNVPKERYLAGYGIAELTEDEVSDIIRSVERKLKVTISFYKKEDLSS
jgi:hypothetical protein